MRRFGGGHRHARHHPTSKSASTRRPRMRAAFPRASHKRRADVRAFVPVCMLSFRSPRQPRTCDRQTVRGFGGRRGRGGGHM
eukprot:362866-Chlamydomonas_euryale.AAC.10